MTWSTAWRAPRTGRTFASQPQGLVGLAAGRAGGGPSRPLPRDPATGCARGGRDGGVLPSALPRPPCRARQSTSRRRRRCRPTDACVPTGCLPAPWGGIAACAKRACRAARLHPRRGTSEGALIRPRRPAATGSRECRAAWPAPRAGPGSTCARPSTSGRSACCPIRPRRTP